MTDVPDSKASVLFDFADQLLGDLEAGRHLPLAHYLLRFPGHEEQVAREYLLLTGKVETPGEKGESRLHPRDRIGPYRLIEILGRGGQGVVYRAVDTRLERTVALKVLSLPVSSVSQGRRNRFRREAEILSRLDHPGVCTVLDADLDCETPYIAMRFVEGETLAAALGRARDARLEAGAGAITPTTDASTSASRLLAPRRALELAETLAFFERAARTLHAAHEAGVVHRDVKPGNIMVTKEGLPVLLDFGLARGEQDESLVLTRVDEVFGTPAYLSPEQARSGRDVDRRTDVYSLGVVLHECLTLDRPTAGDASGSSTAVAQHEAASLRKLSPGLPQDLAVVLETATERDVARRYPTALELAEELRRVREYEPIRARPAGVVLRMRRWIQRNPVVATAVIGSLVALSSALLITLVLLQRVNDEKAQKQEALDLFAGGWYRDQASSFVSSAPSRALRCAIVAAQQDPGLASNRVLLSALEAMYLRQVLVGHGGMACQVDVDPTSRRIASVSTDRTARVWDLPTGAQIAEIALDRGPLWSVRFSPDGERLAIGGEGGFCRIALVSTPGSGFLDLPGITADVGALDFSPDGSRVVAGARDGSVRMFDTRTGLEVVRLVGHTGNVSEVRFTHDGRWVLTRSSEPLEPKPSSESDHSARVFDARSGAELFVLDQHAAAVVAFAVDAASRRIVTLSEDRTARMWRVDESERRVVTERVFEAPGKFHDVSFSPDGTRLALSWDPGAKVVDVATGETLYELPDHDHRAIPRIEFSPDGSQLATIGYDDALRVFRASDGLLEHYARTDSHRMQGLRWSPDGDSIVTWSRGSLIHVWYGRERPFLQVLRGHTGPVRTTRFSTAGDVVLTASADGTARTWDARTARLLVTLDPERAGRKRVPLRGARFDPSGERVVTTDESGQVVVWRVRDATVLASYASDPGAAPCAAFSSDGDRLAFVAPRGWFVVAETDTGRITRFHAHDGSVTSLQFTPDGRGLVSGGTDRRVCLWDATLARPAAIDGELDDPVWRSAPFETRLLRMNSVFDARMSPSGKWVVSACEDVTIQIHDARDGRTLDSVHTATPGGLAFDFDGTSFMVSAKYASAATWWRILEGPEGARLRVAPQQDVAGVDHQNCLTSLTSARHAHVALTTSLDRTARLWTLAGYGCLAEYVGHLDAVLDGDVDPEGRTVVTGSSDGTARLWPCDLLATAREFEPDASRRLLTLPSPLLSADR